MINFPFCNEKAFVYFQKWTLILQDDHLTYVKWSFFMRLLFILDESNCSLNMVICKYFTSYDFTFKNILKMAKIYLISLTNESYIKTAEVGININ